MEELKSDRPLRTRVPTEKGLTYQRETELNKLKGAYKQWAKEFENAESALADLLDFGSLQEAREKLRKSRDNLASSVEQLLRLGYENEASEITKDSPNWHLDTRNIIKEINSRVAEARTESMSLCSGLSRRSSRLSGQSRSLSKRADIASKTASLKAELKFLEAERNTATELDKLRLLKQIAAQEARMEVITQFDQEFELEQPYLPTTVESAHDHVSSFIANNTRHEGTAPIDPPYLQPAPETMDPLICPPEQFASSTPEIRPSGPLIDTLLATQASSGPLPLDRSILQPTPTYTLRPTAPCWNPATQGYEQQPAAPRFMNKDKWTPAAQGFGQQPSSAAPRVKSEVERTFAASRRHEHWPSLAPPREDQSSERIAKATSEPVVDPITRLADLLSRHQTRDTLPRPEPEVFAGDLLRFPQWNKAFATFIERKTGDPSERLYYLSKYTAGEAKEAINGLLSLDTVEAYSKARKTLSSRYGNSFLVASEYRKRLDEWPKISANDGPGLRKFSDFLQNCHTAMSSMSYLNVLNGPEENRKLLKKLPSFITNRWSRIVDKWIGEESDDGEAEEVAPGSYPPFVEFCRFLKTEARIACNPVTSHNSLRQDDDKTGPPTGQTGRRPRQNRSFGVTSHTTGAKEKSDDRNRPSNRPNAPCSHCTSREHGLDLCVEFGRQSIDTRRDFVIENRLCWGCLRPGHSNKECRNKRVCNICKETHPTSMHGDTGGRKRIKEQPKKDERESNKQTPKEQKKEDMEKPEFTRDKTHVANRIALKTNTDMDSDIHTLIVPVKLHHTANPGKEILTYALLDDQSDACFITDSTLSAIGVEGPEVKIEVSTVIAQNTISCQKITGLVVRGIKETSSVELPKTYSRDLIPARHSQIPRPESAERWPHLQQIAGSLNPVPENAEVGLLIGSNCPRAIKPRDIIPGGEDDPYAVQTSLGWGIVGAASPNSTERDKYIIGVNRIITQEGHNEAKMKCFVLKTRVKELMTPKQIHDMFALDFSEGTNGLPLSYEDRQFLRIVEEGIRRREDGHYEIPLPLKSKDLRMPNNKAQAEARLARLKWKLKRDSSYSRDYANFMKELIKSGYAERVPKEDDHTHDQKVWYLPHHGVYHPQKPGKIRVVFDCSAEFKGESLNRHLLQGPDLTNNLLGILCRFRQERTAVMCDIEGMFHQVHVNAEHRNLLRFLWWPNGDIDATPTQYRMTVHLFGATSSPGCANFALKTTAKDHEDEFGSEAAGFMRRDFYVDDGLRSVATDAEAITLLQKTRTLCKKGGFHLHKILSNSKTVIESVPPEERANKIKNLDLTTESLPLERALGVQWDVDSDTLKYLIEPLERPATRRGILSAVSSVYDPLGMLSPLVLEGKQILQELCRGELGWDTNIPDAMLPRWKAWINDLPLLQDLAIPRCYKAEEFGKIKTAQLHSFSDASTEGYGQCSYLRLVDDSDRVHCTLVMAKSRVAPLKPVTIPRLELTAALVSAKISHFLKEELEYEGIEEHFWTDSKVVLGYISNEARRFHVFVANRVHQIRELTSPEQWRYVDTKSNPADHASRGLNAKDLLKNEEWWQGPSFLRLPQEEWKSASTKIEVPTSDPELKKISSFATQTKEGCSPIDDLLERFSNWHTAKLAVAGCLRFVKILKQRIKSKREKSHQEEPSIAPLNIKNLEDAEGAIIRQVQRTAFKEETKILQALGSGSEFNDRKGANARNKKMRNTSCLYRLDPFLDEDGILRIGGRIKRANLPYGAKHPCILPGKSHVTTLIIRHYHERTEHQGRGITLNTLRASGYWITSASNAVSNYIGKCVSCKKQRAPPQEQRMADLPEDRLGPSPPFTYSAVDYFGPWTVKEGRRQVKRYGVLFTCMASRAVHLETANSLTTSSFINAYRRFIGRRGTVRQLRSDRGTNLVGSKSELQAALDEIDDEKIRQDLLKDGCDWINLKTNVPSASHMGGSWERQIRTVRNVLNVILDHHSSQVDDEDLRTFMVEAETIVNSRPLTVVDPSSPVEPLSPNQLLTMKSNVVLPPPGRFQSADMYCRHRWRRVQYLTNLFWDRWKKEYLSNLQTRQKWQRPRKNLQEGDVVIIKDDLPRNQWRLARVVDAFPSDDGLVRKVKVMVANASLDSKGRRKGQASYLERPVQKLVLLLSNDET